MAELLKCPFCGGEAKYEEFNDGFFSWGRVECRCGATITAPPTVTKELWNTRKTMEAVVAELENASYRTDSTFDEDGYCNDDSEDVVELHTAISIVRGKE